LSDRSPSSVIRRLSASDSGILVRLANASSSGSQIDLQADAQLPKRKPGQGSSNYPSAANAPPGSGTTSRPVSGGTKKIAEISQKNAAAAARRLDQKVAVGHKSLTITQSQKVYWIAGAVVMFILAVLLGVAIARLTDSWKSLPVLDPASQLDTP